MRTHEIPPTRKQSLADARQATGGHGGGETTWGTDGVAVLAQSLSDVFADGPCGMVGFM